MLACGERGADAGDSAAPRGSGPPSVVAAPTTPYREVAVAGAGAIAGTITFEGTLPPDTAAAPTGPDAAACGMQPPEPDVVRSGDHVAEVVVWLPDVREGKPLPVERRFELTNEHCRLTPRVQAVVAGGTLNVRSVDPVMHRTRLTRLGTGERLASITSTDAGTVVPDDRVLAKPGQLAAACEVHPWSRAWLFVFDHPYAAVTERDGGFRLDGVPPGRHRVHVWHSRFGLRTETVTVPAGQVARLDVRLGK